MEIIADRLILRDYTSDGRLAGSYCRNTGKWAMRQKPSKH